MGFLLNVPLFFTIFGCFTPVGGRLVVCMELCAGACAGACELLVALGVGAAAIFAVPRAVPVPEVKPDLVVLTVTDAAVPGFTPTTVTKPFWSIVALPGVAVTLHWNVGS